MVILNQWSNLSLATQIHKRGSEGEGCVYGPHEELWIVKRLHGGLKDRPVGERHNVHTHPAGVFRSLGRSKCPWGGHEPACSRPRAG